MRNKKMFGVRLTKDPVKNIQNLRKKFKKLVPLYYKLKKLEKEGS